MGGKTSDNSEMINMQKEEAAAARTKEAERQGRINTGLDKIRGAFEGAPVMASRATTIAPTTWSGTGALPAGYTRVPAPSGLNAISGINTRNGQPSTTSGYQDFGGSHSGGYRAPNPALANPAAAGGKFAIRDANGNVIQPGGTYGGGTGSESYDTGQRSGGIGDDFFNKYKQAQVDYYMPQVGEKYNDAKDELTYRLARAGTLRSSMANTESADLSKQNTLAQAKVRNDADAAAADLRGRVASERSKAESQLYATENPDVAANQATAAIRNISGEAPATTPLGDIFSLAAVGGANFLKGAANQRLGSAYVPGYRKSTSIVGA